MLTSSFSRLKLTTDINDSLQKDGFVMIEVLHNIQSSNTLTTSTDVIEPLVSHKSSDIQSKDPTLPIFSCSVHGKFTTFLPLVSLKHSDTKKITTPSTACKDTTLSTSTSSSAGKVIAKEEVYPPEYERYKHPLEEGKTVSPVEMKTNMVIPSSLHEDFPYNYDGSPCSMKIIGML